MARVLITGGAGFIGSHLVDELLAHGYDVRVLDELSPQVHGDGERRPAYLADAAELLIGDVGDRRTVEEAVRGVDAVVHLAARVGVGQSMYEIARYTRDNSLATATLLEVLTERPVARLVVASSMSVYGEGLYLDEEGEVCDTVERDAERMRRGEWEPCDAQGRALYAMPTPEDKTPNLASVYALSKYDQERLCLMVGEAYSIPTVALRLFNVYGPRQALSNPYTGVLAIFACRLLNGNRPLIYEDGRQRRDFVSVYDVARAFRLALEAPEAPGKVFNVGSGTSHTVAEIARRLADAVGRDIEPEVSGKHRAGDIRHCFADVRRAYQTLDYRPQVTLEQGVTELAEWLAGQGAVDHFHEASAELATRGLAV